MVTFQVVLESKLIKVTFQILPLLYSIEKTMNQNYEKKITEAYYYK